MARVYASKAKGLRIATRCATIEQFIAAFHRTCDASSFFVPTLAMRPVGLETAFSVDLASGQPVLRGLGKLLAAFPTADNPFERPGVQIGVVRLTSDSAPVFEQLLVARDRTGVPIVTERDPSVKVPPPRNSTPMSAERDERTPGSDIVLPANPLMNMTDESLEGFIDSTLLEVEPATPSKRRWWQLLQRR